MKQTNVGIIRNLYGALGSGLVELELELEGGEMVRVPADGGATIRALRSAFGNAPAIGRTIQFETDDLGVLANFTPED
jgi:hypothetical protein